MRHNRAGRPTTAAVCSPSDRTYTSKAGSDPARNTVWCVAGNGIMVNHRVTASLSQCHWLSGSSGALFHTSVVLARWGCGGKAARSIVASYASCPATRPGRQSIIYGHGCRLLLLRGNRCVSHASTRRARAHCSHRFCTSCVGDDDGRSSERLFVGTVALSVAAVTAKNAPVGF